MKLFRSTLKDPAMKFKIYCTGMHDLGKKEECESFEGRWVNLAFYRESDTARAKMSVSIFTSLEHGYSQ